MVVMVIVGIDIREDVPNVAKLGNFRRTLGDEIGAHLGATLYFSSQQNASQLKSKASAAESIWRIESKMTQIAFYCCISTLLSHFVVRMVWP